jgi:glutathione dehydrogenase/transferase
MLAARSRTASAAPAAAARARLPTLTTAPLRLRTATMASAAAAAAPPSAGGNTITLYIKGDPAAKKLGDCPFCHRVLLTAEAKGVPYASTMIDLDNKPEWLVEKASGKVPVLERAGFWLPDSDEIVKFLEREFPVPSMAAYDHGDVGAKLFPAFRGAILAEKGSDEEKAKLADLDKELDRVDGYLASHAASSGGALFGGNKLDAADASFAPKLYHAKVALTKLKGAGPLFGGGKRPALERYWQALTSLDAWKKTDYGEDAIVAGWERHVRMHK